MYVSHERPSSIDTAWSVRMADSILDQVGLPDKWHYEHALLVLAINAVGRVTGLPQHCDIARRYLDQFIQPDGAIRSYRVDEFNLDQINPGRVALLFAGQEERYDRAIALLQQQLAEQPRTPSGGFWHKQIYPNQMWLDGIYMASPFRTECAMRFGPASDLDDVAFQIQLLEEHTRDPKTGLLYHAWDESRMQGWAHPEAGTSPHFWGRAVGWFAMALVDVLELFPATHPARPELVAIVNRLATAIAGVQDSASGLWYQVLDQGTRAGNYHEASASSMFVFALAKGVRLGLLGPAALEVAKRGYAGILRDLLRVDAQGQIALEQVCAVAGLSGTPYRDGSYEYYVGEQIRANDFKGVGPFILASLEIEAAEASQGGARQHGPA